MKTYTISSKMSSDERAAVMKKLRRALQRALSKLDRSNGTRISASS